MRGHAGHAGGFPGVTGVRACGRAGVLVGALVGCEQHKDGSDAAY